jgi:hypothetical protein
MKKKIAFYYQDLHQKHLFRYIANHLNKKKFNIFFTNNLNLKCDFGFYAENSNNINKINAKISFISLGGMDQGKLFWPNLWIKENWQNFDFGILPGKNWANMWKNSSWYDKSSPKKGMLLTGWPKTEHLKDVKLSKKNKRTILYAPGFETDNKGMDVVDALKDTNIKLLIKHLPWDQKKDLIRFKDLRKNIIQMIKYAKYKLGKRAYVINVKENIMNYYNKADILVTDESSVIYEALLYNLPSLSCEDWPMRSNNRNKPRSIHKNTSVCNYVLKENLRNEILYMFKNIRKIKNKIVGKKKNHFSYINNSGKNLSKILENFSQKKISKFIIKPKYRKNYLKSRIAEYYNYFNYLFSMVINRLKSY